MHVRFPQSVVLALAGGFVVVASQAFTSGTTAWLAFSLGVLAVLAAAVPALARVRNATLALDATTAVLGAWTVVASLVFAGSTVRWLSFAEALGFVAIALAGLTIDHLTLARAARRPVRADLSAAPVAPATAAAA